MGTITRKATFTVVGEGKERIFTPVNKRAKCVAKKLGKRTKVTAAELRSSVGKGTYKFYFYTPEKTLKAIRV
jgi:hypothetical protein